MDKMERNLSVGWKEKIGSGTSGCPALLPSNEQIRKSREHEVHADYKAARVHCACRCSCQAACAGGRYSSARRWLQPLEPLKSCRAVAAGESIDFLHPRHHHARFV